MKVADVERFQKAQAQLEALYKELTELSRKHPHDLLNAFKLTFVNRLLAECNTVLTSKYQPFAEFTSFDEESPPSNSDVVMMVNQYLRCMEELRCDNIWNKYTEWFWRVDDTDQPIPPRTAPPSRLRAKE